MEPAFSGDDETGSAFAMDRSCDSKGSRRSVSTPMKGSRRFDQNADVCQGRFAGALPHDRQPSHGLAGHDDRHLGPPQPFLVAIERAIPVCRVAFVDPGQIQVQNNAGQGGVARRDRSARSKAGSKGVNPGDALR